MSHSDLPKVLVIDDHELVAEVLDLVLFRKGFCVETATTARQAMERIGNERFALVVTDLVLPGSSGVEIIRKLKASQPECRIIAMTGHGEHLMHQAMEAGADAGLHKPFTTQDIMQAIEGP